MKTNLTTRMISLILAIVLLVGVMPTAAFATEQEETTTPADTVETVPVGDEEAPVTEEVAETTTEPVENEAENVITPAEENVVNVTADTTSEDIVSTNYGRTFRMPGRYYDFITSHERYGTCDYLAYVSGEELIIFFFDEDISNKEFVLVDAWGDDYQKGFGASFGCCPQFTSYTYDKNTLELKGINNNIYPLSGYKFTYTYVSSFDVFWYRYNDPRFYDHAGSLPRIDIPNPPADTENVTMGRKFNLPGDNLWVLQNCEEYGKKDYLAFIWEEIYVIWFFDDINDVKFYKWDNYNDLENCYGIRPSRKIAFTKYTFNRSTLKFNEKEELMLETNNRYGFSYDFTASIDIYWDNSYDRDNMFYDHSGTLPKAEVQNPPEDVWNVTNGKSFHMKGDLLWLLQNRSEYGSKDYLAYEWNDDIRIWFFDDLNNVKFATYEKFGDNFATYFGIRPSVDVTFTEYVYNKNTLKFKREEKRSFVTTNGFTFMYPFTASFSIYTDNSYNEYFYDVSRNWTDNPNRGEPVQSVKTTTSSREFSMGGYPATILTHHSEYGKKDYLAGSTAKGDFVIWFFDDLSNVKLIGEEYVPFMNFSLKASQEVKFTQYVYEKNTWKIKNVKPGTNADLANTGFTYFFVASFDIYKTTSYSSYFYRINGDRPELPSPEVKAIEANMKNFHMDESYCDVIKECPEYKQGQRYLSYLWADDFVIWFFDDPDVKFSAFEKIIYFGVRPSVSTQFKAYVYDRKTLELKSQSYNLLDANNGYTITYNFVASFDIYVDETYKVLFYQGDEEVRNASSLFNVTNGRTFSMPISVYAQVKKLQNGNDALSSKNFLAYSWKDKNIIWFFDDPNITAYMQEREVNTFGLVFPKDVQVTAFLYNRETGEFIEQSTFIVGKSSEYTFRHYFMADFNIFMNEKSNRYFYNASNNTWGRSLTFKPLTSEEAENFLRFLANANASVNIEEKLPRAYKFLTGNVESPEQDLQLKAAFLAYAETCMNVLLKSCGKDIDKSETKLIEWLKEKGLEESDDGGSGRGDENEKGDYTESFMKNFIEDFVGDLQEDLLKTIAEGSALEGFEIKGVNTLEKFLDYTHIIVNTVNGVKAIRTIDNIQYLKAYKGLLDAIDRNDESSILLAELNCHNVKLNMAMGGDIEEMETYAKYLYLIERSLPVI